MTKIWCALMLIAFSPAVRARGEGSAPALKVDLKVYRVMTSVSGTSSQRLEAPPGVFHEADLQFGLSRGAHDAYDVHLVMKGDQLTWDGEAEPDHEAIKGLAAGSMTIGPAAPGAIKIVEADPPEYFERAPDGSYKLKTIERETGVRLTLKWDPERGPSTIGFSDFVFESVIATGRKPLAGVSLDVGEPILDVRRIQGPLACRPDEWFGMAYEVPSQGRLYVFLKAARSGPMPPSESAGRFR